MYKIKGHNLGSNKMRKDMEQLSKSNTLLARLKNLLEERSIDVPPDIEEGVEEQLESYEKYLDLKIQSKARERREDLEAVERAMELAEERNKETEGHSYMPQNLRSLRNEIEKEVQRLESMEAKEVLADPEWQ